MTDNLQPPLSPALNVGGWVSGGMGDQSALRVVYIGDDLIEIVDGSGTLLSLSVRQAAGLVEDLTSTLDVVGWPS